MLVLTFWNQLLHVFNLSLELYATVSLLVFKFHISFLIALIDYYLVYYYIFQFQLENRTYLIVKSIGHLWTLKICIFQENMLNKQLPGS